jgi:hypothetical protein
MEAGVEPGAAAGEKSARFEKDNTQLKNRRPFYESLSELFERTLSRRAYRAPY